MNDDPAKHATGGVPFTNNLAMTKTATVVAVSEALPDEEGWMTNMSQQDVR